MCLMLYRLEGGVAIVDNIFHELQDYENKMMQLDRQDSCFTQYMILFTQNSVKYIYIMGKNGAALCCFLYLKNSALMVIGQIVSEQ